jgi:uracil-DNA glycosylase family 4
MASSSPYPVEPGSTTGALAEYTQRLIACDRCPRLRAHCTAIAETRRRAWRDHTYWGLPVPSFGDPQAQLLILGLAPGAHGSNRTGRPFTGDGSGNFLYPVLYESGFASQPESISLNDGMQLHDAWITSVVRCAPPGNKPTLEEQRNCAPWLDEELALLPGIRVIVCLGRIAWDGFRAHLLRTGCVAPRTSYLFSHGAEYTLPDGRLLIGSYHPSLQNTNTGRLTRAMFLKIFARARESMK